jgi:hypothetical protein
VKKKKMNNAVFRIGMVLAVLAVLTVSATTPAVAHVDVYFSPSFSTFDDIPIGGNVSVQVLANVTDETDGFRAWQVGVDFNPNVVNITKVENPCKFAVGETCYVWWWTPFSGLTQFDGGPYGRFVWITGGSDPGYDSPVTAPLANLTIKRISPGEILLDISPREFSRKIRYSPSVGFSMLFDKQGDDIPESRITWNDISEKQLCASWNLISLPFVAEDNSTSSVLASVGTIDEPVYKYNAATKAFESVTIMDPGIGYFVHLSSKDTWMYNGTAKYDQMNISLEPGLNMIGALSSPKDANDVLNNSEHWYATTFDAPLQKYNDTCNPVAPSVFNRLAKLVTGAGYFISAKQGGWLNVSC